jgi:hypothetical protein
MCLVSYFSCTWLSTDYHVRRKGAAFVPYLEADLESFVLGDTFVKVCRVCRFKDNILRLSDVWPLRRRSEVGVGTCVNHCVGNLRP